MDELEAHTLLLLPATHLSATVKLELAEHLTAFGIGVVDFQTPLQLNQHQLARRGQLDQRGGRAGEVWQRG